MIEFKKEMGENNPLCYFFIIRDSLLDHWIVGFSKNPILDFPNVGFSDDSSVYFSKICYRRNGKGLGNFYRRFVKRFSEKHVLQMHPSHNANYCASVFYDLTENEINRHVRDRLINILERKQSEELLVY